MIEQHQLNDSFKLEKSLYAKAKSLKFNWTEGDLMKFESGEDDLVNFDGRPFKIVQINRNEFKLPAGVYIAIGNRLFVFSGAPEASEHDQPMLRPIVNEPLLNLTRKCPDKLFVLNDRFYCYSKENYYPINSSLPDLYRPLKPYKFFDLLGQSSAFEHHTEVEHVFQLDDSIAFLTRMYLFKVPANAFRSKQSGELFTTWSGLIKNIPIKFYASTQIGEINPTQTRYRTIYLLFLVLAIVFLVSFAIWLIFIRYKK